MTLAILARDLIEDDPVALDQEISMVSLELIDDLFEIDHEV